MSIAGRHIVLVGLMGSGKSSVGRRLAQLTHRKFLDTDRLVEDAHHQTVREMFESVGEAEFRVRETNALRSALQAPTPAVIAAAGGVVLSETNRSLLREMANDSTVVVVWLDTETRELAARVQRGTHRPLLDDDPIGTLETMAVTRRALYSEVATHIVDTNGRSLEEVASEVGRVLDIETESSNG